MSEVAKPFHRITSAVNLVLTVLEKISDETIWKQIFGERIVNLLQKYFGNDFVALSLAIYIAPILKNYWSNVSKRYMVKMVPMGRVSLRVCSSDSLYQCISKYAADHGTSRRNLRSGVVQHAEPYNRITTSVDDYDRSESDEQIVKKSESEEEELAKVRLLPPDEYTEFVFYKGNYITLEFKDSGYVENEWVWEHVLVSMSGRSIKDLHIILQEWSDDYNKNLSCRQIFRSSGASWQYERDLPKRDLDSIHLCHGQKELMIRDMQTFRTRGDWYKKRGIPYRRGYLLYGPPGTGKTSTIQAIANHLDLHISIVNCVTELSQDDLSSLIQSVPYHSIVVIEDIDHLFDSKKKNEEESENNAITMSGLLNIMDGMHGQEGSMIFMTCNNINKIQPALLRPGRVDMKIKLDYAAIEQVKGTFWRFMGLDDETSLPLEGADKEEAEVHLKTFADKIPVDHVTTAELQSFFIDLLLEAKHMEWNRSETYDVMFKRIPDFLERVKRDREQAKKHEGIEDDENKKEEENKEEVKEEEEKKEDEVKEEEKTEDTKEEDTTTEATKTKEEDAKTEEVSHSTDEANKHSDSSDDTDHSSGAFDDTDRGSETSEDEREFKDCPANSTN
ncbi:hypothetical protein EDC96DRAFT_516887 [Choanephora cucurbitarum]|nr:hypothetical protein EDC96DRAFT_516887 [Choanephora cucurbitarum]